MTHDPRELIRIQSPCLQIPGYSAKYASRNRVPSSSPQKKIGIDGIGAVITSSPTSSINGSPSGEYDSTFAPSARQEISPIHTGTVGAPPTMPVQMSVPPEKEAICRSLPTSSWIQRKPLVDS